MAKAKRVIKEVSTTGRISREKIGSVVSAVHIAPADKGWAVQKAGKIRITAHFPTKKAAVDYAKNVSRDRGVDLIIHSGDGRTTFVQVKNGRAK